MCLQLESIHLPTPMMRPLACTMIQLQGSIMIPTLRYVPLYVTMEMACIVMQTCNLHCWFSSSTITTVRRGCIATMIQPSRNTYLQIRMGKYTHHIKLMYSVYSNFYAFIPVIHCLLPLAVQLQPKVQIITYCRCGADDYCVSSS